MAAGGDVVGAPRRLMLFVPMYNCAPQIGRTLGQITPELLARFPELELAEVFVVDNGSTDGGRERALEAGAALEGPVLHVALNDHNYGLGGSHKVAFQRCLDQGYDGLIVFHGDDQGRLADLLPAIVAHPEADCVLGSRFSPGSDIQGYAPHRIAANVAFNGIFSAMTLSALWDLGSGLNFYRRSFLERRLWEGCAEDLTFNYHLLLRTAVEPGVDVVFEPISWREDDQVSNARLWRHGVQMLRIVRDFTLRRRRFLETDHSTHHGPRTFTLVDA